LSIILLTHLCHFLWLVQPCCWYMKKSGHGHPFDVPGLRKYGHREANHNWMSAMMTVLYVYGGREGNVRRCCCCYCKSPHARPHERCMLIRTVGYAGRDLFESMLNYGLVVNHHSHRRRRRRRRRLVRSRARPRSSPGRNLACGFIVL
jgi:hypothetical protein